MLNVLAILFAVLCDSINCRL